MPIADIFTSFSPGLGYRAGSGDSSTCGDGKMHGLVRGQSGGRGRGSAGQQNGGDMDRVGAVLERSAARGNRPRPPYHQQLDRTGSRQPKQRSLHVAGPAERTLLSSGGWVLALVGQRGGLSRWVPAGVL